MWGLRTKPCPLEQALEAGSAQAGTRCNALSLAPLWGSIAGCCLFYSHGRRSQLHSDCLAPAARRWAADSVSCKSFPADYRQAATVQLHTAPLGHAVLCKFVFLA